MRAEEIRGLSDGDLSGRIAELERERFNLRFKGGTQPLEDPLRLRVLRKDIARLRTIQTERKLGLVRATPETAAPAKKAAAKKSTAKKAAAKKSTAKKSTAKQSTAKSAASKSATTKSAATKSTAKKTAAKQSTAKRAGGADR